ncbi:MAG: hypothetical protein J0I77_13945 [Rudaea sp.]|uniref:hypothetical protein n=1 Tax=unclassified Rudaea TaxID=2627037 RepID=UPI0010F6EC3A|nr:MULTISPECIES: hypothetical protein [unclassified Rudaea]MBN8886817.1 hypothetical protein [Rudaea sp.]
MSLLDDVRKGRVVSPTRRGFDKTRWRNLAQSTQISNEDRALATAGVWFDEKLSWIRSAVTIIGDHPASVEARLRGLIALCNRETLVTGESAKQRILRRTPNQPFTTVDEFAGLKLELSGGGEFSPDEIIQSTIDSAQIPIAMLLREPSRRKGPKAAGNVDFSELAIALNIGVSFASLEDRWDDIVWNDFGLTNEANGEASATISPNHLEWVDREALSSYRDSMLILGGHLKATRSTKDRRERISQFVIQQPEVVELRRQGKRLHFVLGKPDMADRYRVVEIAETLTAVPIYYATLETSSAPNGSGLTLIMVIAAWNLIASAMRCLWESISSSHDKMSPGLEMKDAGGRLGDYLRIVKRDALISLLRRGLGFSKADAQALVEFFTYRAKPDQELWTQPFVPISTDRLTPVFAACLHGNLSRSVDRWLQQLGFDLSPRGNTFEAYVRENCLTAASASTPPVAQVVRESFVFAPKNEEKEEIDLVIVVGNLVLLGEAKCTVRPTSREMWSRHRSLVLKAVSQIQRKIASVNRNRESFRAQLSDSGIKISANFEAIPFVVLNHAIHAGIVVSDVPVLDEILLIPFVRNLLETDFISSGYENWKAMSSRLIYETIDDAPKAAREYFFDLPQIRHLWRALKWRRVPIWLPPGDSSPCEVLHVTRTVEVDADEVAARLSGNTVNSTSDK